MSPSDASSSEFSALDLEQSPNTLFFCTNIVAFLFSLVYLHLIITPIYPSMDTPPHLSHKIPNTSIPSIVIRRGESMRFQWNFSIYKSVRHTFPNSSSWFRLISRIAISGLSQPNATQFRRRAAHRFGFSSVSTTISRYWSNRESFFCRQAWSCVLDVHLSSYRIVYFVSIGLDNFTNRQSRLVECEQMWPMNLLVYTLHHVDKIVCVWMAYSV